LRVERGCDFVQHNVYTKEAQEEIDVLAVNFQERTGYLCEVATTGLLYVTSGKTDTFERFVKKFNRHIDYAEKASANFTRFVDHRYRSSRVNCERANCSG
ncbi:MAG: hypothetical protein ABJB74_18825, partial [Gemmatimonas sp.]